MAGQTRVIKGGPGPAGEPFGKNGAPNPTKTLKRTLGYMLKNYKFQFLLVVICIMITAFATLEGSLFMQSLIDDYIVPMTKAETPDFVPLMQALTKLAGIFAVGVISSLAYNKIMVYISQGTMRNLRVELFTHMESLPIKYFDTHAHGDIMSVYTNDVDTLRQLMGQSIPQVLNSAVTIVMTFISMIVLDIPLTILTLLMVGVMTVVSKKLAEKSGKYFGEQQMNLGKVNGYIEEMMDGQKVVKVFCHEEKAIEEFQKLNEELRKSADNANTFANIMMPINNNLGIISYVLCSAFGAILAISGIYGLSLGTLVSFLTLNKSFTQPVTQISQQMNSIVMAMAGADRIFHLLDAEPEVDDGYVELVNAKEHEVGTVEETI